MRDPSDPMCVTQTTAASVFRDYDASGYLEEAIRLLGTGSAVNYPDFRAIFETMPRSMAGEFCRICDSVSSQGGKSGPRPECSRCVVLDWKMRARTAEKGERHGDNPFGPAECGTDRGDPAG